jgi:hypothetical protein
MQLHPGVLNGDEDLRGIDDRGRHAHHGVIRVRLKQEQARTLHRSLAASGKQIASDLAIPFGPLFLFSFSLFRLAKIRGELALSTIQIGGKAERNAAKRKLTGTHLSVVRSARREQQ